MQITAAICKHQAQTKKSTKHRSIICRLQNANSCTKRRSTNTGAAVLAPHGAFGSAAPVSQSGVSRRVGSSLGLLQTPDLRRTPPYPPTRPPETHPNAFCRPSAPKSLIFGRLFADRKFIKNSNAPKTSKVGPLIAQTSILGSLLESILVQNFMKFSISS